MAKDPSRKAPRRARRETPIDDDLAQLAEVLAEHSLDNTAYGWFQLPWRNGKWAVGLARDVAMITPSINKLDNAGSILELLDPNRLVINSTVAYEEAGELYRGLIQPKLNTNVARLLAAGLRCLQLKIANSHGGGASYNEVLIPAFLPIEPILVEKHVLEFRCQDALGITSHLQGDANDRFRSAFSIAWKRGLYFAAYSIKAP